MTEVHPEGGHQSQLQRLLYSSHFLDTTSMGIMLHGADGRVLDCNRAAIELLGDPIDQLVGRTLTDSQWGAVCEDGSPFPADERPAMVTLQSGNPCFDVIVGIDNPAMARRWLSVSSCPVTLDDDVTSVVTSFIEASERIQKDQLLKLLTEVNRVAMLASDEAEFLQQLCNVLVDQGRYALAWIGAISSSEDGGVDIVCAAGATDYLYDGIVSWWGSKESGLGPTGTALRTESSQVISDLANNAGYALWRERAAQFGLGSSAAVPFRIGDRRMVLTIYDWHIVAFDQATVKGLESIVREAEFGVAHVRSAKNTETALGEITVALDALTETEHALSESEQRFRLAFENNTAPMVFSDLEDRVIAVNDAFSQMVGYSKDELQGHDSKLFTHPDDVGITEATLQRMKSGEIEHVRYVKRYLTKDGREVTSEVSRSPARDSSGKTLYYVTSERDITEERGLSAQLAISQRLEAIGTLAGGVAHDFNNLLLVIRGYTSLLIKNLADDELLDAAKRIDMTVDEAASFIRKLLAYSRQQLILPQATDLNEIVREGINLMERLLGDDIVVTAELRKGLPLAWVDPTQVQQVLLNLISNARDAMPSGGTITFRTDAVDINEFQANQFRDVEVGSYALLEVEDNGVGMDEATLGRIFEPYFTTKTQGTGLGLATVYGITKQSRGHLEVKSTLGIGTTFKLYFPLAHLNTSNGTDEDTRRRTLDTNVSTLSGTETILVAEDIDETRELLTNSLRELGYGVLDARGGVEALELSRGYEGPIAVVVSDVVMPDLNGYELAHQLIRERPTTHVILTSGYAKDILGGDEFANANFTKVQKPYHLDDIAHLIRQLLDSQ